MKVGMVLVLLAFQVFAFAGNSIGQGFPYAAPQAPEFDDGGNSVQQKSDRSSPPQGIVQPRQSTAPKERTDYRSVRPYSPQEPPPVSQYGAAQPPQYQAPPQYQPPAQYEAPPQYQPQQPEPVSPTPKRQKKQAEQPRQQNMGQGPPANQGRSDCTEYPMLIARSQSESEMQMTARRYLTCLLQNGWQMDQAKQQVIATIESTYKLTR